MISDVTFVVFHYPMADLEYMEIEREYAALMLIEILFEERLVNKATYDNAKKYYQSQNRKADSHISQIA